MSDGPLVRQFREFATGKLADSLANVERCTQLLDSEQVWWRPNEVSNSVGNLVLHLTGNVRQWIVAGIGGEPFDRDRAGEFSQTGPLPTDTILGELRRVVERAIEIVSRLDEVTLVGECEIQGYRVTGTYAVAHAVEHFSFHTGQIVSTTKLVLGRDLSLYDENGRRLDDRDAGVP